MPDNTTPTTAAGLTGVFFGAEMTPTETTTFLRRYNEWRRTDDRYGRPYPDPREIGAAIDAAIAMIERTHELEIALREFAWSNDSESQEDRPICIGGIEMIDTKELRRLAQDATPHVGHACKYRDAHWLREGHVDFENADLFIASERPQEDAAFYAAANPAAISELLDRLEAAEKERDALRAKVERMERQEPFDADNDVFRSAFEAALKAGYWPAARQGDGYRAPSTQIAWWLASSTLARLKLYLAPGAKGE